MQTTAFKGAKLQCLTTKVQASRSRVVIARCDAQQTRRAALGLAAGSLLAAVMPLMPAKADLTEDLLAKTVANKELNDKKRLATSYSNLARSRTVTEGTCQFPGNVLGCDVGQYAGDVAFIADDAKIECEGKDAGKCASNMTIKNPGAK